MVCGKDACLGCVISLSTPSKWWHNYEHWCCTSCWDIGKERREILDAAEKVFKTLAEEQFAIWRHDVGGVEDV